MAYPSLLARTKNWGTEILTDSDLEGQLDLLIDWINDAMNSSTGHKHDGTTSEGPKILVSNLTLTSGALGDIVYHDGTNLVRLAGNTAAVKKIAIQEGDGAASAAPSWGTTIDYIELEEQSSAPSTGASEGALYTKDTGGQPELYYREESDGDEVQITNAGGLNFGFGSKASKTVNTVYQAVTDGFLLVRLYDDTNNTEGEVIVKSDASNPPTTVIGRAGHWMNTGGRTESTYTRSTTVFVPIIKDDYYKVEQSGDASNLDINFIPLS